MPSVTNDITIYSSDLIDSSTNISWRDEVHPNENFRFTLQTTFSTSSSVIMKDHIPIIRFFIGISCFYHDSGISIIDEDQNILFAQARNVQHD